MEQALLNFFNTHAIDFTLYQHEPIFTTEQANRLHTKIAGAHSKNLFLKDKKRNYFLLSILDHKRVDLKSLSKQHGKGGFSFASPEDLMTKLHLTPGSVTPYALLRDTKNEMNFILDEEFLNYHTVNFHPLRNDMTVNMTLPLFLYFFKLINHPLKTIKIPVITLNEL